MALGKLTRKSEDGQDLWPRVVSVVIIALAVLFLLLAITQAWQLFWTLAMLPGAIGLGNIAVALRHRQIAVPEAHRAQEEEEHAPKFREAFVASILLTAVFCVVARNVDLPRFRGLVYAGYGAYISTLWFMLVRLNASALSPRFLVNSAVKTAIALTIGYVAGTTSLFQSGGMTLFFLVGLFHSWALESLRRTAMATFGVTVAARADLSVRTLEGVDEGAASVLEEMGVTCVQHLATMCPAEVCGRSLYPRERVFDWIDQSILAIHTNGRLAELRTIGIRCASALVAISEKLPSVAADQQLKEASRRMGLPDGGITLIVACIRQDPTYNTLVSLRDGHVVASLPRNRLRPADRRPLVPLEVLHRPLVLLRRRARGEGA